MSFSIQTNVNSIIAQENLRVNSNFQSLTIQRLTSGYRINSSGDDAAGLAVANKFRSDTAELTQGVRNANDGVSQLQIMDGGMNNIGKMLDRLKTLATQSASSTFTGDRSVLNKEYQTLVSEIDRQAQSIGLSTGGHFAQKMGVYIGGGTTAAGAMDTANGTVSLSLADSVVDSKALGLRTSEFKVDSATGTNLATGSNTSVANIVNANSADAGKATFELSGAGFDNTKISVTLTASDTTSTLVDKLNAAIEAAGNANTATAAKLAAANIRAKVTTDSSGNEQLTFSSSGAAFQVAAGTATANALLGNFKSGATNVATGDAVVETISAAQAMTTATSTESAVKIKVIVNGTTVTLAGAGTGFALTAASSATNLLADITGDASYGSLSALGVTAQTSGSGAGLLQFVGDSNQSIEVRVEGDQANFLGLGSWSASIDHTTGAQAATAITSSTTAETAVIGFSINGGEKILISVTSAADDQAEDWATKINAAIATNTQLTNAGIHAAATAAVDAGHISFTAGSDSNKIRYTVESVSNNSGTFVLGLGTAISGSSASLVGVSGASNLSAAGASETGLGTNNDVFSFAGLRNAGGTSGANADQQVVSFNATDINGTLQSVSVTLSATNAYDIDTAVNTINTQLQTNATLKNVVAVKETNAAGTAEGIRFISSLNSFSVNVGKAVNNSDTYAVGLYDGTAGATTTQGMTVASSASGTMDISTSAGASQAVVALGAAVQKLGAAQAAVGKGQNQLNYAIGLANSQISNFSSAQSQIRDADVAAEAANLSKAQVLQQASIAAMAQANSAPQAVLALLRG